MSNDYECIECGCQFIAEMMHADSEDRVVYCVNCGTELEDELDENFYEDDE
jgi:DNA-directed RNA polymerase subunit RPC12/RpoP